MSELEGNPNHDDSRNSILSNLQIMAIKTKINEIMDSARKSTLDNDLQLLQDFKTQLDNIPEPDLQYFSLGIVTVNENVVEKSNSENTPDTSCNEEMTLLQKACYFHLNGFAQ